MKKFLVALFSVLVCSVVAFCAACKPDGEQKKPEKLKDGISLTLTEGDSKSIDLAEYISVDGTDCVFAVSSSDDDVVTATLAGNAATVTALSKGSATVTASAGEVSVTFPVTVNERQTSTPEKVDKTALTAELALEISAQGDYTEESYSAYTQKLQAAKTVNAKDDATQDEVDAACRELKAAREGLVLRVPEEADGAVKTLTVVAGLSTEITVSDYIDAKNLSSVTYEVSSDNALLTVGDITGGKFTVTAGETEEDTDVALSICVKYKGETKLTVIITVTVTSETSPVLNQAEIVTDIDLYSAENKTDITLDFAGNVENAGEIELTYSATMNGSAITLDGASYTFTYGSYTDTVTEVVFAVTVSFSHNNQNKTLNYNYILNINDTSANRVANGGFDDGLDGWILTNPNLGGVNSNETYWGENVPFNNDGNFFNAYFFDGEGKESATGTLTSSSFKIGGSGWITYKLGGAKNADKVYIDIIEKNTGNILARYHNNAFSDDGASTVLRGCTLVAYKADLSAHIGKTVYIRISDNAVSDYGLFFADSFETYNSAIPAGEFTDAVEITDRPATVYDIYNGGFESDLKGWTVSGGDIGAVTTDKGYWNGGNPENTVNEYGKEGDKLFSWWSWDSAANDGAGAEVNREGNMGTLTSSMFVLKAGKYVSFKFGGGENRNVFIELVNAESGTVIAVLHNDNVNGGRLISYSFKVDGLSQDTLCYFRISDNAVGGWGCFAADDFRVNLDSAPEGSIAAVNRLSEYRSVVNGSFENGNLDGWTMAGELGAVVDTEIAESWYQTNESTKDGDYLFTFHFNNGTENVNVEGNKGIVRSSAFILEKNGIISFRFGAAHNSEVYINVYTTGGQLIATFRNNAYTQDTVMVQYYYQFDNTEEISCYFEVVDNATGDYGCIVMDDFCVNLETAPENAVLGSSKTKAELG